MTALLLILLLAAFAVGWFFWPSITAGREDANRLREIDRLRQRALLVKLTNKQSLHNACRGHARALASADAPAAR